MVFCSNQIQPEPVFVKASDNNYTMYECKESNKWLGQFYHAKQKNSVKDLLSCIQEVGLSLFVWFSLIENLACIFNSWIAGSWVHRRSIPLCANPLHQTGNCIWNDMATITDNQVKLSELLLTTRDAVTRLWVSSVNMYIFVSINKFSALVSLKCM